MLSEEDMSNSFEYVENFPKNDSITSPDTYSKKSDDIYSNGKDRNGKEDLNFLDIYSFDLNHDVVDELEKLINSGHLIPHEINPSLIELLRETDQEAALNILKQIQLQPTSENSIQKIINLIPSSKTSHTNNQESHKSQNLQQLTSLSLEDNISNDDKSNDEYKLNDDEKLNDDIKSDEDLIKEDKAYNNDTKGPDDKALQELLDKTGYSHSITSGQRKYGGPPPEWDGPPPPVGSEIYVGKIPRDIYEDKLIPLFEQCGKIWDFRLMLDPISGLSKGFAFLQFIDKDTAIAAVKKLNNYEIRPGKGLKMNISIPNLRLFVGNIPKSKSKDEIFAEFSKLTDGLANVIVYSTPGEKRKNRGFCFLEYQTHLSASVAKKKLTAGTGPNKPRVWNCDIIVEWADVQDEPNEETMAKVKVLYVRNLALSVTEANLREVFERFGKIEHVKKLKDYAFVHYATREDALKAMEELQNSTELPGGVGIPIEISLAKPPSEKRLQEKKFRELERKTLAFGPGGGLSFAPPPPSPLNPGSTFGFFAASPHHNGTAHHQNHFSHPQGIYGGIPNNHHQNSGPLGVMGYNPRHYLNNTGYSHYLLDGQNMLGTTAIRAGTGISYYPKMLEDYEYDFYGNYPAYYHHPGLSTAAENGQQQILEYANNNGTHHHGNAPNHVTGLGSAAIFYNFKPAGQPNGTADVGVGNGNTLNGSVGSMGRQTHVPHVNHGIDKQSNRSNGHYHQNNNNNSNHVINNNNNIQRPPLLPPPNIHPSQQQVVNNGMIPLFGPPSLGQLTTNPLYGGGTVRKPHHYHTQNVGGGRHRNNNVQNGGNHPSTETSYH